jgi:hypothetical protein
MDKSKYVDIGPHAASTPVDDTYCDFGLDTAQEYFEKICDLLKISRPSFSWGRSGNVGNNAWLINNEVPSNRVGTPFNLDNGRLERLWVGNQNPNTFSITIYEHDGNQINLTALATVTLTSERSRFFDASDFGVVPVTNGKQIGVRITSGSAKNPEVFAQISGT